MAHQNLLYRLLARGDQVALVDGILHIQPASGQSIPCVWFSENRSTLLKAIGELCGLEIFQYDGYSTGRYGPKAYPGITLQFSSLAQQGSPHAHFNACLSRKRNSKLGKAGDALKAGRFSVGKKSAFYSFWLRSGLRMPSRLSAFYDYMGGLKSVAFIGQRSKGDRLDVSTLDALRLPYAELVRLFEGTLFPNNAQANNSQCPSNIQTTHPNSEMAQGLMNTALPAILSTCKNYRETSKQVEANTRSNVLSLTLNTSSPNGWTKRPQDQTTDEWLEPYNRAANKKF